MRGPSSSHTAASHRIGSIIRQVCRPGKEMVRVEFDRNGSLATTYEGQGSAMGLICGLLGVSILDPALVEYRKLAKEQGLNIEFKITDFENTHPNTYKIQVENDQHEIFSFVAISTGGGMVEVIKINGFEVSIKGDYFETLVVCKLHSRAQVDKFLQSLRNNVNYSELILSEPDKENLLINIKSRVDLTEQIHNIGSFEGISWVRHIRPVMPILSGMDVKMPFSSVQEMLALAEEKGYDLAELAIIYESARAGLDPQEIVALMKDIVSHVGNSIQEGLKGSVYSDRLLGHQSHLIMEAEKEKKIVGGLQNTLIAYVTAIMEAKSSMGIIVAAPTAGSSGVLGGAVFAVASDISANNDAMVKAFLAAGLIGVIIADRYTFAAEKGGCQVECGAASGMAAAGLAQLMGGTAKQAIDAASLALQNILGLVCDPVADRVEVPCLGKNILGATNALTSANMSIAGFDPVIPLDEVIDAMKSVGESMPSSLCCTGLGGLSITPTSLKLHQLLLQKRQMF